MDTWNGKIHNRCYQHIRLMIDSNRNLHINYHSIHHTISDNSHSMNHMKCYCRYRLHCFHCYYHNMNCNQNHFLLKNLYLSLYMFLYKQNIHWEPPHLLYRTTKKKVLLK